MSKSFYSAKTTRKRNNSAGPLRCLGVRPWCKLHLTIVSGKCQVTRAADVVQCLTLGLSEDLSPPDVSLSVWMAPQFSDTLYWIQCCDVSHPDPYVSGSTDHMVYANVTGRISGQMSSDWSRCVQISHNTKHFNKCDEKNYKELKSRSAVRK